jgi:hypothetical protein
MGHIPIYSNDCVKNDKPLELNTSGDVFVELNKYDWIKKEIDDFTLLKSNWDGYGGTPVLDTIAQIAKQFIPMLNDSFIDRITDIYPNPHGTITIEWKNSKNEKLSLEIGEKNYSYFVKYQTKNPTLENGENIISDFKKITTELDGLFVDEIPTLIL